MYSKKFRARLIQRLTGPEAVTQKELAMETGVSQGTLSRWLKEATVGVMPKDKNSPRRKRRKRTPEEKFRLVAESMLLTGEALGAFLRREGLYEDELDQLREEVRDAAVSGLQPKKRRGRSPEQRRIAKLEKELLRKEKALAEAAALLVLQGKVRAFLASEDEEGDTDGSNEP